MTTVRRIVTVPKFLPREELPGELLLRINLGVGEKLAFGFGSHPSTSLALGLILGLYGERAPRPRRVLDVGCGTGVLSIACARLGAAEVRGVDVEEVAVRMAQENAAANDAGLCSFDQTPVQEVPGTFDLVLANLPWQVLTDLAAPLCARARGGLLLISGYGTHRVETMLGHFTGQGLRVHSQVSDREWGAALLHG